MKANNLLLNQVLLALQLGKQKEALNFIDDILDYCIDNENGKVFYGWDRSVIRKLIAYHLAKKTIITTFENEKLSGVFMWYYCNSNDGWDFVTDWHEDNINGDSIFLAFLFASNTNSFKKLCSSFISKVPFYKNKKLLGVRNRGGNIHRVEYKNKLFNKILSL